MISIECFNGLPIEYESFLMEKYGSFITTCRYIEIYYASYDNNYMLVYNNGILSELLIFGIKGNTCICFNSLVSLDQNILSEFIKKIFEEYPAIKKIKIDASCKNYDLNKSVLFFKSDDQILNLPSTLDDYYLELGTKTRKHIKARNVKLINEFKNVSFVVKYGGEIEKNVIDKIIQFNRDRMKHKGKVSGIGEIYKTNIYNYSQHYGCVAYLELDGSMVAGCIATIVNKKIYLHVIAHDENFSRYNVGEVCVFNLIHISIDKGLSTFHFLWGQSELKRRFLAKSHILFSYFIYRRYSLDYFICKLKINMLEFLNRFKQSKVSTPIRNGIINFRKKMTGLSVLFNSSTKS
jgi:hypothetical protein